MGRPKASEKNLAFAFAVAEAVTKNLQKETGRISNMVLCRGEFSIFGILANCVPGLIRLCDRQGTRNRNGLTEQEFNKYLIRCGYSKIRIRNKRVQTLDGEQEGLYANRYIWKNRQWIDPADGQDLMELRTRLSECLEFFATININLMSEAIIAHIKRILTTSTFPRSNFEAHDFQTCLHDREYALSEQIPRTQMAIQHRLHLSEKPAFCWPSSRWPVPPTLAPVFYTFFQVITGTL
jgi:hypothetical protein